MPRHITIAFPGQGSQYSGMLNHFSDKFLGKIKQDVINALSFNIFEASENDEELNKTSVTQPAILLASYLEFKYITENYSIKPDFLCGHSLGEYSALAVAGSIDLIDAIRLVHERGKLMEKSNKGQMYAILNTPLEFVSKYCSIASKELGLVVSPANINSPKQIVISGDLEAVELTVKYLKENGVKKCIKLNVSTPSHCDLMTDAAEKFTDIINNTTFKIPNYKILHNVDVNSSDDIHEIKNKLINQLTKPVQWVNTMEYIKNYDSVFIECGPKNVLCSLAKANTIDNIYSTSSKDFINEIEHIL
tara:strand:- start:2006 stop:2920 length:915 start_codon:yes stop_codon:yes gene_type:complete